MVTLVNARVISPPMTPWSNVGGDISRPAAKFAEVGRHVPIPNSETSLGQTPTAFGEKTEEQKWGAGARDGFVNKGQRKGEIDYPRYRRYAVYDRDD